MYTEISELKYHVEFLMKTALDATSEAIRIAEENNFTDEQWFLDAETKIGYAACQDHNKNKKC